MIWNWEVDQILEDILVKRKMNMNVLANAVLMNNVKDFYFAQAIFLLRHKNLIVFSSGILVQALHFLLTKARKVDTNLVEMITTQLKVSTKFHKIHQKCYPFSLFILIECEYRSMDIPMAQVDSETFLADFPDERACARECQKDINCEFFVYLTENFRTSHIRKGCVLKFGIDGAELVKGQGLLSSYRTCKFP